MIQLYVIQISVLNLVLKLIVICLIAAILVKVKLYKFAICKELETILPFVCFLLWFANTNPLAIIIFLIGGCFLIYAFPHTNETAVRATAAAAVVIIITTG